MGSILNWCLINVIEKLMPFSVLVIHYQNQTPLTVLGNFYLNVLEIFMVYHVEGYASLINKKKSNRKNAESVK